MVADTGQPSTADIRSLGKNAKCATRNASSQGCGADVSLQASQARVSRREDMHTWPTSTRRRRTCRARASRCARTCRRTSRSGLLRGRRQGSTSLPSRRTRATSASSCTMVLRMRTAPSIWDTRRTRSRRTSSTGTGSCRVGRCRTFPDGTATDCPSSTRSRTWWAARSSASFPLRRFESSAARWPSSRWTPSARASSA